MFFVLFFGLRGLDGLDIWIVRGRGNVRREEIFEKSLPKNVGWVADNAEDGKLEDRIKVERERCAILICRKSLSEDVGRYAEKRALQRLR